MYSLLLLLFIIYSFVVFFINSSYIIILLILIELIVIFLLKIFNKRMLKYLVVSLPFIIMVVSFNYFFDYLFYALIVGGRLFIVVLATYIISTIYKPLILAEALQGLLFPLKIFKIDVDSIAMIVVIGMSMIPILVLEVKQIKLSLIAKGFKFNLQNLFSKPHIFVMTYIYNVFIRVDELELTLKAKGYNI